MQNESRKDTSTLNDWSAFAKGHGAKFPNAAHCEVSNGTTWTQLQYFWGLIFLLICLNLIVIAVNLLITFWDTRFSFPWWFFFSASNRNRQMIWLMRSQTVGHVNGYPARKQGNNSATHNSAAKADCSLRRLGLFFRRICPCTAESRLTVNNMLPCFQKEPTNMLKSKSGWRFSCTRGQAVHFNVSWLLLIIKIKFKTPSISSLLIVWPISFALKQHLKNESNFWKFWNFVRSLNIRWCLGPKVQVGIHLKPHVTSD